MSEERSGASDKSDRATAAEPVVSALRDREAERAAIVAEGLTEAQRKALLRDTKNDRWDENEPPMWLHALHMGMTGRRCYTFPEPHSRLFWTPLGLAVRDHLRGEQ